MAHSPSECYNACAVGTRTDDQAVAESPLLLRSNRIHLESGSRKAPVVHTGIELRPASDHPTCGIGQWITRSRGDALAILAIGFLTIAFFWPMIRPWPPRLYMMEGDFSRQFYPFRFFEGREWWSGRIPLWNPDMFAGHPFQADVQTAVFYPLAFADAVAFGRHGLPYAALEGEVVVHTFLAGLFTYMLARLFTRSRLGALVAGVAFAFGGFITSYPAEQLPLLETAVWLPVIVLFLELAARRAIGWRWLVLASGALGIAVLAGHSQTLLFILYATEAYVIWRFWRAGARWTSVLASAVIYPLGGACLSAVQILPTLEFLGYSTRDQMSYTEAAWGYLPSALWEVVVPLWHDEKALSIGVVALVLAARGAWVSRREPLAFWTVAGLLALPLSLGGSTPLFWLLYHLAPGWNLFRDQERVIYLFSFAASLLAGRGVADLLDTACPLTIRAWAVVVSLGALLALGAGVLGFVPGMTAGMRRNLFLDAAVLAALAVLLAVRAQGARGWSGRIILAALVPLIASELFVINAGNNLSPTSPVPVARLERTAEYIRTFPEPFRVRGISEAVFPSNYGMVLGLPTIGGDTPIQIRRMRDMLAADADWRVWQILNVKFFISDRGPLPGLTLVFQDGNLKTYKMEDSLPRAWAVRKVLVAPDLETARRMILVPANHPGDVVVLERRPSIGPFHPGPRPDVRITHLDPQRIAIDADADGNAMLVLAQQYYPDWIAYRDGQPVPTFRANVLAMAFELPPGRHHFEIVYRPWSFYLGAV